VDEQKQEKIDGPTSAERKSEWIRPELSEVQAGAAEAGDVSNPDGGINS
jgi:hypothetical protein